MKKIFMLLMPVLLWSCAYNANLKVPGDLAMGGGKARYNLKSAIVLTAEQKSEVTNMQVDIASVSFSPYPAIYQILQEKMRRVFTSVDLVMENELTKEKYDILIYPTPRIDMKRMVFEVTFTSTGLETKGESELFRTSNQQQEIYQIPPGAAAAAFLTGFTLFIASPITIPLSVKSIGEYSEDTITKLYTKVFEQAVDQILSNPQLKMYAEGQYPPKQYQLAQPEQAKPQYISVKSDVDEVPSIKTGQNKNAYAIVIGIESYRQRLPKADFAVHDAEKVTEYLVKTMGYPEENVVTLTNDKASKSDFEKYFGKWLANNVEKEGSVFIYYSGHGAPNPKTGDAFLVPYDGDPTFIDETGYPLSKLYEQLGKLPAKEIIVALDSCFSGAGGRSVIAKGARPIVMNLVNPQVQSGKIAIMAAASGDQMSSTYDDKGHGLFTYFMLKGIKGEAESNGSVEIGNLFEYIKPQVERVARKQYNNEQSPTLIAPKELMGIRLR